VEGYAGDWPGAAVAALLKKRGAVMNQKTIFAFFAENAKIEDCLADDAAAYCSLSTCQPADTHMAVDKRRLTHLVDERGETPKTMFFSRQAG
jgi:hypothetical protein